MGGVLSSAMGLVKAATGNAQRAEQISRATRTSPADVVSKNKSFERLLNFYFYLFTSRFLGAVVKILKRVLIPRKLARLLAQ